MTLNGVIAVGHYILRYFAEVGKPVFQHITTSICGGIYTRIYCFVVRVLCRRKESRVRFSSPDECPN